jgi:hypothetical protein
MYDDSVLQFILRSGLVCYGLSLYKFLRDRIENTSSDVLLRRNVYRLVA